MALPELTPDDYRPRASKHKDIGIGIIGCGDIVRFAHLPAYSNCGYNVVAACDIDEKALDIMHRDFGVENVSTDPGVLLDHPDIQVVDLAVHCALRRECIEKITAAGKHVFSQKPIAMTLGEARELVEICERAGVTLMINQQARWAPAHAAIKVMLDRGVCGHVYSIFHFNRSFQDQSGTWYVKLRNSNIVDHGIHFIDLSRHFSGMTPRRVHCTTTTVPGQAAVSPMIYDIALEYDASPQYMGGLHFNNVVAADATHRFEWCIDGSERSTQQEWRGNHDARSSEELHSRHIEFTPSGLRSLATYGIVPPVPPADDKVKSMVPMEASSAASLRTSMRRASAAYAETHPAPGGTGCGDY